MDTTKSHGFSLASFLVLMFLRDLTEACRTCPEISLRDACCEDDFVMRVQFMSVRRDPNLPMFKNIFNIQPIQVFKGPRHLRNSRVLYTRASNSYCGYQHRGPLRGDDYLISGKVVENNIEMKNCNLAIPWEQTTLIDKMNLNGVAGRDCSTICPRD
ncbi:metalloproteinase inhibitor 1-like [Pituophis catenifer annectens]|uniref:metalloproteinase inhibitor 1-like n=1 Tax=Pituophis catenifer annectens TaxID=94852 RepID=UPI003992AFB8